MLDLLKKTLTLAGALALLLLLLYIAFYLFLFSLICIIGVIIYLKIKGIKSGNSGSQSRYWWQHKKQAHTPHNAYESSSKTVIIESTEYRDISDGR